MEVVGSDGSKCWSSWKVTAHFSLYGQRSGIPSAGYKTKHTFIHRWKKKKNQGFSCLVETNPSQISVSLFLRHFYPTSFSSPRQTDLSGQLLSISVQLTGLLWVDFKWANTMVNFRCRRSIKTSQHHHTTGLLLCFIYNTSSEADFGLLLCCDSTSQSWICDRAHLVLC